MIYAVYQHLDAFKSSAYTKLWLWYVTFKLICVDNLG